MWLLPGRIRIRPPHLWPIPDGVPAAAFAGIHLRAAVRRQVSPTDRANSAQSLFSRFEELSEERTAIVCKSMTLGTTYRQPHQRVDSMVYGAGGKRKQAVSPACHS